jgi:hypothetical protein
MSDRLALANAIEEAGIERSKAERVASVIVAAIYDHAATKADVQASETAVRADIAALDARLFGEIRAVRAELTSLDTRLTGQIQALDTRLTGQAQALEARLSGEIGRIADRTLIRLSGVMVVLLGILFAALKWHS